MKQIRQPYHMIDGSGPCGVYELTENEVALLTTNGWNVVPAAPDTPMVKSTPTEHYHLVDSKGDYQGARLLSHWEARVMRELGWYLTHVGDASKDQDEIRAIKSIDRK